MNTPPLGHPTDLTPSQARRIVIWHRRREDFKRRQGSVRKLAASLRVPLRTVYNYLSAYRKDSGSAKETSRGRPRALSPMKVRRIERWYNRRQRLLSVLGSANDLARDLGITEPRVFGYIRRASRKPPHRSPKVTRKSSVATTSARKRQAIQISVLLRAWKRGAERRITPPPPVARSSPGKRSNRPL